MGRYMAGIKIKDEKVPITTATNAATANHLTEVTAMAPTRTRAIMLKRAKNKTDFV